MRHRWTTVTVEIYFLGTHTTTPLALIAQWSRLLPCAARTLRRWGCSWWNSLVLIRFETLSMRLHTQPLHNVIGDNSHWKGRNSRRYFSWFVHSRICSFLIGQWMVLSWIGNVNDIEHSDHDGQLYWTHPVCRCMYDSVLWEQCVHCEKYLFWYVSKFAWSFQKYIARTTNISNEVHIIAGTGINPTRNNKGTIGNEDRTISADGFGSQAR